MKNTKFIIFLILFSIINNTPLFAQDTLKHNQIKVTYENVNNLSKNIFETELLINETNSQFIYIREKRTIEGERYRSTIPYFKYISNFNFSNNIVEENRVLEKKINLYSSWKNEIIWEIHNEEKTLNGHKVRKATTNSFETEKNNEYYYGKAIAWYAIDIPIPSGPARYYGLPGLILELSYEFVPETFIMKKIEYVNNNIFQIIDKTNVVEKEDVIYYFHKDIEKINKIIKN
jgi:GLPGLI family protein